MKLIADNLHVVNPVVQEALDRRNPKPIRELVKKCEKNGADAIDINTGPLPRNPENRMTFMVETVQSVTDLPLLIDTANPTAMEAGLAACRNPSIINGFSLEPHKLERILPLAKKYQSDIIGYLLYPDSRVPCDATERFELVLQIVEAAQNSDIETGRLIIDPVIVPLTWHTGSGQAAEILTFLRNLPDLLGFHVQTIAGLSNLVSGSGDMKSKLLMEQAYLPMLAAAGLDMVLFNIFHDQTRKVARAGEKITCPGIFSWVEL